MISPEEKAKRYARIEDWRRRNRERSRAYSRNSYYQAKYYVLEAFGGKCQDCGSPEILQIHHKDGDGLQHRLEIKTPEIFRWLKRHPEEQDKFELLCRYCHGGRHGKKATGGNHGSFLR